MRRSPKVFKYRTLLPYFLRAIGKKTLCSWWKMMMIMKHSVVKQLNIAKNSLKILEQTLFQELKYEYNDIAKHRVPMRNRRSF